MKTAAEEKICCFTGHRTIPRSMREPLTLLLDEKLEELVGEGVREFRAGGALGFDTLAATRVLSLKKRWPECRLHLILPCKNQSRGWGERDKALYGEILAAADRVSYMVEEYTRECMHMRNRALVEGSDFCVAFLRRNRGGTLYTCAYALKRGVTLLNLADDLGEDGEDAE